MRIIGGEFRSRHLVSPDNDITRPTTDRSRESVFNVLNNMIDLEGRSVLDLFAGSGAVAFEAISRGASNAVLVERDRKALLSANANIDAFGLRGRVKTSSADVFGFLKNPPSIPFDLIFADAPYAEEGSLKLLPKLIFDNKWLSSDGICIIEHSAWKKVETPNGAIVVRELKVGEAGFTFLSHPGDEDNTSLDIPPSTLA